MRSCCRGEHGLSLIELILFIVIVSVALAGVLGVLSLTAGRSADPVLRKQVLAAAEAMMEEVLLKDFANGTCLPSCAPNSQADRSHYTAVDHYSGWNQTGIRDLAGTAIPGLAATTMTVDVAAAALGGIGASDAKRVTVTASGAGESVTLVGWRTNY